MPFPEPAVGLESTTATPDEERSAREEIVRPGASWRSLRHFNHLHRNATTYGEFQRLTSGVSGWGTTRVCKSANHRGNKGTPSKIL